jgi:hypothetical protein
MEKRRIDLIKSLYQLIFVVLIAMASIEDYDK